MALQMNQLFAGANPETLAQLNAASQLLAASILQQQQHQQQQQQQQSKSGESSESTSTSRKSNSHRNTGGNSTSAASSASSTANSSNLLCSMCSQVCRDPSDYEQHLMTHLSVMSVNQNAYQYGLNILRMQNLFGGNASGGGSASANNGTSGAIPGATVSNGSISGGGVSPPIMNKKRKLLAKHQAELESSECDLSSSKRSLDSLDSLSRLSLEHLFKSSGLTGDGGGEQQPQSVLLAAQQALLAQFAANAKGSLGSPPPSTKGVTNNASAAASAFPCTSCHKTFATEVDLKAHLIRHLTQHPFVCTSCSKGFKYEHSLNFHVKSYHSGGNGSTTGGGGASDKKENADLGSLHNSAPLKLKKGRNTGANSASASTPTTAAIKFEPTDSAEELELDVKRSNHSPSVSGGQLSASASGGGGMANSVLHSRLTTLMDENHNAMATATTATTSGALSGLLSSAPKLSLLGACLTANNPSSTFTSTANTTTTSTTTTNNAGPLSEVPFLLGKPPTNLPPDSPVQIRSEKLLVSILDAVNVATDQSLIFYKCCVCCVAFASLEQMSIHVQNVHLPPGAAASAGAAELFTTNFAVAHLGGKDSTISTTATSTAATPLSFSCDKCTAKFGAAAEYDIHMQLHRTLEAQAAASNAAVSGVTQQAPHSTYPFNLLSHLHPGLLPSGYPTSTLSTSSTATTATTSPATVDFRQILANASKDTDFGRKFAAQLLQESAKDHLASLDPYHALHHRSAATTTKFGDTHLTGFDRCSPPAHKLRASPSLATSGGDANNNSLLYLSLLPDHAKPHHLNPHNHQHNSHHQTASSGSMDSSCSTSTRSGSGRFGSKMADSTTPTLASNSANNNNNSSSASLLNLASEAKAEGRSFRKTRSSSSGNNNGNNNNNGGSGNSAHHNGSGSRSPVGHSSRDNNSTNNTPRHLKEPVDIFEGAGQSLPIEKFPIGDIEETAPGQFKCRFCEKTFDRVFSVHRHERVHTGFKPCICKTCGRGFSEKRNLRHHIIRFHSDGSGRELLKRKRKPKSGSGGSGSGGGYGGNGSGDSDSLLLRNDTSSIMSSLLSGAGGGGGGGSSRGSRGSARGGQHHVVGNGMPESLFNVFRQQSAAAAAAVAVASLTGNNNAAANGSVSGNGGGSLSNLKLSLAELDRLKNGAFGSSVVGGGGASDHFASIMNLSNGGLSQSHHLRPTSGSSSSSRRRKTSKPSRKVYEDEPEDDEDEGEDEEEDDEEEEAEEEEDDEDIDHGHHHHQLKKEMLVVDVDVMPMVAEDDDDDDGDEDEADELVDDADETDDHQFDRSSGVRHEQEQILTAIKQEDVEPTPIKVEMPDDGEETEEEEETVLDEPMTNGTPQSDTTEQHSETQKSPKNGVNQKGNNKGSKVDDDSDDDATVASLSKSNHNSKSSAKLNGKANKQSPRKGNTNKSNYRNHKSK